MSARYPHVFSPIKVGPIEVPNRFFLPPHGINAPGLTYSTGGAGGGAIPSTDLIAYWEERAAGGVGLLIHSVSLQPRGRAAPFHKQNLPAFQAMAEATHAHGAKIFAQLYTLGTGAWEPNAPTMPPSGPSVYQRFDQLDTMRELGLWEISQIIEIYAECARNLVEAGYDGIQVHATHASLHELFLSPYYNKRADGYGGDVAGRLRFLVETLEAVRAAVGPSRAVGIRYNCDEMLPGGLTQEDGRDIVERLITRKLIDFLDLDIGVMPQQAPFLFPTHHIEPITNRSFLIPFTQAARGRIVVMAAGPRVARVSQAEEMLASGVVDMVGAVRGLIAEPRMLIQAKQGKEDESRVCIACNVCTPPLASIRTGWGCVLNPSTGRERHWSERSWRPAPQQRRVAVIGAGLAGLEAARVAALRGHTVTLFERSATIGGQYALWAGLPGREDLRSATDWFRARVDELGVDLRLGTEATADGVLGLSPDAVVVATGAHYSEKGESGFMPVPVPGWDRESVYTPERILEGGARPAGQVVILDEEGFNTGVGVAEVLARGGAQVEIVSRDLSVVSPYLLYSLEFMILVPRLRSLGVAWRAGTYVKEIGAGSVTLFDILTNEETTRACDAVVLATMRKPQNALVAELEGKVDQLFVIGDALAPRKLLDATFEGQRFARLIGEPAAPRTMAEALFAPVSPEWGARPARPAEASTPRQEVRA